MKLTNTHIKNAKFIEKPRKLADGGGLYLLINASGKYWRMDYRFEGKRKTYALGVYPTVTLNQARVVREEVKQGLKLGVDPVAQKQEVKRKREAVDLHSFERVTLRWIENYSSQWSVSHKERVLKSFKLRVFPYIGHLPLERITAQDILVLLRRMENEGLGESVRRLKQNIERVFTFAVIEGILQYNPAQNLEQALKPQKAVQHQKYLKLKELPDFFEKLSQYDGGEITKLAIEFTILTLARTGEVRYAAWQEIDWEKREWLIPPERMKMGESHIVPLSEQAIEILMKAKKLNRMGGYIFEGDNARKPISENTMLFAMYRLGYRGRATIHGFRSTGSTILNEKGFRADVIERLLAHGERNKIRAAYNHAEYLDERKQMLQWYADKLDELRDTNNVVLGKFERASNI